MKSDGPGEGTSVVELSNVSPHGMWLLVDDRELYLPFAEFPWFRDASIAELGVIEHPAPDHLRWPDLDVDLSIDSIDHPGRYPLVSGVGERVREALPPDEGRPKADRPPETSGF